MPADRIHGAFLVDKPVGVTSFHVVHRLKRALKAQKMGHGGTLDPFATGLLVVFVGNATRLAQYFLGSPKSYEGVFLFGKTTASGDLTTPVTESTEVLPSSLEDLQARAHLLTVQPYLQTPPMYSAKKVDGTPLYELARKGIEIDRKPKVCNLYRFEILSLDGPRAHFHVTCSSGTYIRVLAQDLGKLSGSLGVLESLKRTASGHLSLESKDSKAYTLEALEKCAMDSTVSVESLPCFIPFDRLLDGLPRADASQDEAQALRQGRQRDLVRILLRAKATNAPAIRGWDHFRAIYCQDHLVAVAKTDAENVQWHLDRVF